MRPTDIAPAESWALLEEEIWERSGMRPRVYDAEGAGFTDVSHYGNELCKEIQAEPKGQTFICAVAHTNMATMARKTRAPVIEECDAGLVKVVVPIHLGDEFLGTASACGKLLPDGEADAFMVSGAVGMSEDRIGELATTVPATTMKELEELAAWMAGRIQEMVAAYKEGG